MDILLYSLAMAGIAMLLDLSFESGMIFGWWLPYLERIGVSEYWRKPLGGCIFCTHFWLCVFFGTALFSVSLEYFCLSLGLSHLALHIARRVLA